VGAWVKPTVENQQGRVNAVAGFEAAIGRQLGLVNVYHQWADGFPSAADIQFVQQGKVLMISWNGNDVAGIASGAQDAVITARAAAIKELGSPILLRWRWEMNRPNLAVHVGSPAEYIAAWKHIRSIFRAVGATNVGWVWCPLATNFETTQGPAFYPGDDQVDWLCTDVYPGPTRASFGAVSAEFMAWAASHSKPIVIGEYGSESSNPQQTQWIAGAAAYALAHPQIKAMTYFEVNLVEKGVDRNFLLEGTTGPLQAFRSMVANPWFKQPTGRPSH
jgi:beta-mannanase